MAPWKRFQRWEKKHPNKAAALLFGVLIIGVLAISGAAYAYQDWHQGRQDQNQAQGTTTEKKKSTSKKKEEKKPAPPKVLPRHIDGMIVAREEANKLPVCVMIENAAFGGVRPQSGLSAANVVYEVIVEGGITRLMALYAGDMPPVIGPVRSARDTYLEFASEYNCPYVHAGGSFTALQALRNFSMRDVDALLRAGYFYRDPGKVSPHNLFVRGEKLVEVTSGHHWRDEDPTYTPWKFVDQNSIQGAEVANRVQIGFGGAYDVEYRFNAAEGYYERFNGGSAHRDANTGAILNTRNIVIQRVGPGIPIQGKGRVNWPVTGEGEVLVVRNGQVTKGKWMKANRQDRTRFVDESGNDIPLARGNTWVEIVPEDKGVTID